MVRHQKSTYFIAVNETTTVLCVKRTISGMTRKPTADIQLVNFATVGHGLCANSLHHEVI